MKLLELINEKRERDRRQKRLDTVRNIALGSVVGMIAGIMLAPKSGKETRQDIVQKTKEIKENTKNTIKDSIGIVKEVEEKVKERVKEFKDRDMFEIDIENEEPIEDPIEDLVEEE